MNEDALRLLIRDTIARQVASPKSGQESHVPDEGGRVAFAVHPSHFRYALPGSGDACLIEPTVQCNHCGYCQSHGH